jgi:hypothetical protein
MSASNNINRQAPLVAFLNPAAWFLPERLPPAIANLIYWRDYKKSGLVFGTGSLLILALSCFSVISVIAWLSVFLLGMTFAYRFYLLMLQVMQKTDELVYEELFKFNIYIRKERAQEFAVVMAGFINNVSAELVRLFLIEDVMDSIKFGLALYFMTYIGSWFNVITLVLMFFVSIFTIPKAIEKLAEQVNHLKEMCDEVNVAEE